jgi:hypothetical protein
MTSLFEVELARISDPIVSNAIKSLAVIPKPQERKWFYGIDPELEYLCWLVIEHPESSTGIAYSDFGFGPKMPWGLVFLHDNVIGMDSEWFTTLERAFYDSFASEPLEIWNVVQKDSEGKFHLLEASLSGDKASAIVDQLYAVNKPFPNIYFREPRNYPYYSCSTDYFNS